MLKVVIVYNAPQSFRYQALGESLAEEDVLNEVKAVHNALIDLGHQVNLLPLNPPMEEAINRLKSIKTDVFFNLFEGFDSNLDSEAAFASALENTGIPFTGCHGNAIALAQDKPRVMSLLKENGILTPRYQVLNPETITEFNIGFPCIVKPTAEHASHGISSESVAYSMVPLLEQVRRISTRYGGLAMVEDFIDGREFSVTVTGNKNLAVFPISEIVFNLPPECPKILTFAAKWKEGSIYFNGTKPVCPADLSDAQAEEIMEMAKFIFTLTGCRGYARVDMRQDNNGDFRVLDVNPNPDISPEAGVDNQRRFTGMTYTEFIEKVLELALQK